MKNKNNNFQTKIEPRRILFVGLSNKPGTPELSVNTATGKVIREITEKLPGIDVHKTNATRHAPLDARGKLRYPTQSELESAFPILRRKIEKIRPAVIVSLGNIASRFLMDRLGIKKKGSGLNPVFIYQAHTNSTGLILLPIHHPSFVLIYRRTHLKNYVNNVAQTLRLLANDN